MSRHTDVVTCFDGMCPGRQIVSLVLMVCVCPGNPAGLVPRSGDPRARLRAPAVGDHQRAGEQQAAGGDDPGEEGDPAVGDHDRQTRRDAGGAHRQRQDHRLQGQCFVGPGGRPPVSVRQSISISQSTNINQCQSIIQSVSISRYQSINISQSLSVSQSVSDNQSVNHNLRVRDWMSLSISVACSFQILAVTGQPAHGATV